MPGFARNGPLSTGAVKDSLFKGHLARHPRGSVTRIWNCGVPLAVLLGRRIARWLSSPLVYASFGRAGGGWRGKLLKGWRKSFLQICEHGWVEASTGHENGAGLDPQNSLKRVRNTSDRKWASDHSLGHNERLARVQKNSFSPNWMMRIGVRRLRTSPSRAPSGTRESVLVKLMRFGSPK